VTLIQSALARRALALLLFASVIGVGFAASTQAEPVTLIPRLSEWNYYAGPTDPGAGWQMPGFPETGWSTGIGPLGYGEDYVTLPNLPYGDDPNNKWVSYYFRRTFFLNEDPSNIGTLRIGFNYDDGAVVYINGVEVARKFMPAGIITWGTLAADHESYDTYEETDITAGIPLLVGNALNTIAVEIHQTTVTNDDLVMDLELIHSVRPVVMRGPYLQNASSSAISVRWRSHIPSNSRVWYGSAPGSLTEMAGDPAATIEHEVRLSGLAPQSRYYYAVGDYTAPLTGDDDSTFFRTNPVPGDAYPTRAWVIGDAGWNSVGQQLVRNAYATYAGNRDTDLWLMLGDNAYNAGTDAEYTSSVFNMYRGMLRKWCLWTTRGNHDLIYGGPANDYYDHFTLPSAGEAGGVASTTEAYYSFDYGNIHFICLDTEGTSLLTDGAMAVWLRQDIAATYQPWTIAFWHHPPYTRGSHISDNEFDSGARMGNVRRNILPILDSTGVDLVLNGHSHSYERSFLLNGHYGTSGTLTAAMVVDSGFGRPGIDGPYVKPTLGSGPFEGAVYVVAGSSGTTSGGTLNHPVMVESLNLLGSLVLDVAGNRLDAHFIGSNGAALDSFTIVKGPGILAAGDPPVHSSTLALALSSANPARRGARFDFTLPRGGSARLDIFDMAGRRLARVAQAEFAAGSHRADWSGRSANGEHVAAGVYFAVLESGGERRAVKVVIAR